MLGWSSDGLEVEKAQPGRRLPTPWLITIPEKIYELVGKYRTKTHGSNLVDQLHKGELFDLLVFGIGQRVFCIFLGYFRCRVLLLHIFGSYYKFREMVTHAKRSLSFIDIQG